MNLAVDERLQPSGARHSEDLVRALALTTVFGDRTVLDGVDVGIRRGEVFVIMGPSGCGKTTLLRHLCGLQPPTFGSVAIAGHDLYAASPAHGGLQAVELRRVQVDRASVRGRGSHAERACPSEGVAACSCVPNT